MFAVTQDLRSQKHRRVLRPTRLTLEPLEARALLAVGAVRSIDGTLNNLLHPEWGSTDEQLLRRAPADYGDGVSSPAGADRPSAREVSNALAAHGDEDTPNARNMTAYIYIWGQFLDHDLDLTGSASPTEAFNIPVPAGDPAFDPSGTGTQVIPLKRSIFDPETGTETGNPRQQINQLTAWIDGSMIYGSDEARASALRTFIGGRLKSIETEVGELLPSEVELPGGDANDFLAGDIRVNENIELTSMHTLFLREHNRLADKFAAENPALSDEELYQRARAWVIGEIQAITYNEWLPALLGSGALVRYRGYNPNVNPNIANEFSTAAFRLHTTINDDVEFFDNDGRPIEFTYVDDAGNTIEVDGEIALADAFFNPTLFRQTGVDGILKYAASTHAEEVDNQIVDSLRDFLFGQPGQGGLDLASLNIQRGRDHGLADYNAARAAYGLPRVTRFSEITSDRELQATLRDVYGDVDNIDLWVGVLAEDHLRGSSAGPLMQKILVDQFQRLRDGDRFWYENTFSGRQLEQLRRTRLSDIIERNTGVDGLQDNVFIFRAQALGQVFTDADRDGRFDRGERGKGGVTVELVNDEGEVIATTRTDRDGRYRFDQFHVTGDYLVRVVVPADMTATGRTEYEFLISAGDESERGLDFGLRNSRTNSPSPPRPGRLVAAGSDSGAAAALSDDHYEDNDSRVTAASLGTISTSVALAGLVQADRADWYSFNLSATAAPGATASIGFAHAQGDLDMALYDAAGRRLRFSNGVVNGETISLADLPAGTYSLRVYGYLGATNPAYSLAIKVASAPTTTTVDTTPTTTSGVPSTTTTIGGGFDIQFAFTGLSASQRAIFEQAAARWESIIVGDVPSASYNGLEVDDLLIGASSVSIDRRGGVLGQAGPDRVRSGSLLPYHGTMQFDTADIAAMEADGTLLSVIVHEIGHVLGIGTLWSAKGLLAGAGTSSARYTGAQATAQYNAIYGTNATGVPVETGSGRGTRDAHWSEVVLGSEVMTGYVGPGTTLPISRITVGSLADLGYPVNYAAADVIRV